MDVEAEDEQAPARDGAGRATLTPQQSGRLFAAVKTRQTAKGWAIGRRFSAASYYDLRDEKPVLLSTLPKTDERMRWVEGSAEAVALRGERPVGLEELVARLRRAVEIRCADRGWDPAKQIEPGVWAKLDDGLDELPTSPELVDLDDAVQWVRGSAEKLARNGVDPIPSEGGPTQVVIQLDAPPGTVTLEEWFLISGRVQATAPQMSPEERGKLAAVLQQMMDSWLESRGR
ncbi:conserved hypothetical protein [Frankia canadensis]|uniref:Uncharacterized protein n=1 Tax=Frankia canadensis TaxID=1836972 RepID=A0A2I2KIR7_9ACTN|nr:hypothetical protein [Frankia canadensis]SNQ45545.1 conserved hypothetical protein [Frankia canadensis]SOU52835.1 conserved hypothetical protein [Frankia canadensis]